MEKLLNGDFDLVLLCHTMAEEDLLRLARIIGSYTPSTPVVFISETEHGGHESTARTVRCRPDQLLHTLAQSLPITINPHAA